MRLRLALAVFLGVGAFGSCDWQTIDIYHDGGYKFIISTTAVEYEVTYKPSAHEMNHHFVSGMADKDAIKMLIDPRKSEESSDEFVVDHYKKHDVAFGLYANQVLTMMNGLQLTTSDTRVFSTYICNNDLREIPTLKHVVLSSSPFASSQLNFKLFIDRASYDQHNIFLEKENVLDETFVHIEFAFPMYKYNEAIFVQGAVQLQNLSPKWPDAVHFSWGERHFYFFRNDEHSLKFMYINTKDSPPVNPSPRRGVDNSLILMMVAASLVPLLVGFIVVFFHSPTQPGSEVNSHSSFLHPGHSVPAQSKPRPSGPPPPPQTRSSLASRPKRLRRR